METQSAKVTREMGEKTVASIKSKGVNVVTVSDADRRAWA
jgi:hypothetical protein